MKNDFYLYIKRLRINPIRWFKTIFWISLIVLVGWVMNLIWYKPYSIAHFYERMFLQYSLKHPQYMSKHGLYKPYWLKNHNRMLDDVSPKQLERDTDFWFKQFDMLISYRRSKQNKQQLLSTNILNFALEDVFFEQQFPFYQYPLTHTGGIHVQDPLFMLEVNQIETYQDIENYIERLSKFEEKFSQIEQRLLLAEQFGVIPPKRIIAHMKEQIRVFLSLEIEDNLLHRDFKRKMRVMESLPQISLNEFNYELKVQLDNDVISAYQNLLRTLRSMENNASEEVGIWQLPDGLSYYDYLLKHHLAVDQEALFIALTKDSLQRAVNAEIFQQKALLQQLLPKAGFDSDLTIQQVMDSLKNNRRYFYENDEFARKDLVNDLNLILFDIVEQERRQPLPLQNSGITCKPMPKMLAHFPIAHYYPADFLNRREATLYINVHEMENIPSFALKNVLLEYVWPGMHLQQSLQRTNDRLPSFRRNIHFSYYVEGWRRYAKDLANDMGMYKTPLEHLARIQSNLVDAAKMQVDLKIHTNNWGYEQAIAYMMETCGITRKRAETEVDWILVNPAKACAYLVGYHQFKRQEAEAKVALGNSFSTKDFYKFILNEGPIPVKYRSEITEMFVGESSN